MRNLDQFTNQYQVTKTLRFELKPVGETLNNIQKNGIIKDDSDLAESYEKMKKTIDEYHKDFIERSLNDVKLNGLENFYKLYTANKEKQQLDDAKEYLRNEIAKCFTDQVEYKELASATFIKNYLKSWIKKTNPDLPYDERFEKFTTYFSGYQENRANMYSAEGKATAISFRLIDQNLPKHIDNIRSFERIKQVMPADEFSQIEKSILKYLPIWLPIKEKQGKAEESVQEKIQRNSFDSLGDLFTIAFYNQLLTQSQIDGYNKVIGGDVIDKKIQGLNEYINQYNQKHPKEKLPKFKMLYKQILSDKGGASWLPEKFDSANELFDAVNKFYQSLCARTFTGKDIFESVGDILKDIPQCKNEQIYIRNDSSIGAISNRIFGYYGVFKDALGIEYDENDKTREYYSIKEIQTAIDSYIPTLDDTNENFASTIKAYSPDCIAQYFSKQYELEQYTTIIKANYSAASELLNTEHSKGYELLQEDKDKLKALLDSLLALLHFLKPLYISADEGKERDTVFYGTFDPIYEELRRLTKLYDKARNFVTQKPYSTEKIQLTFKTNNGNLLNGWVDSKTENSDNGTQYGGYLFRKKNKIDEYDYYLGISANTKLFRRSDAISEQDASEYERLNYYQPKEVTIYGSAYKGQKSYPDDKAELCTIINTFVEKQKNPEMIADVNKYFNKGKPTPSGCIKLLQTKYPEYYKMLLKDDSFISKNEEIIKALHSTILSMDRLIGKESILEKKYALFTDMMDEIKVISKRKVFEYKPISSSELNNALSDKVKPLYLFKILNKDLSFADTYTAGQRKSRGKDNLHTMYFKALMSGDQATYDLGTGQVFFRQKSIEGKTTHKANEPVKLKNPNQNEKYNIFPYDLIKNKRYSCDKFQLHLSMMANYDVATKNPKEKEFNERVWDYLKNNPDVHIIGIDRGERNLLYISLIDRNGNVVKDDNGEYVQYSLNTIKGEYKNSNGQLVDFKTPYHKLLDEKEIKLKEARKNWGTIENIKELKSGYMSQVVHYIAKLMVKYNAIVVLEDLNDGMKNGRKKIEKQVYQNFEKALIEKLNYLVFKDVAADQSGGLYHALQLTCKFTSFKELNKQTGFLFYIPAWNTSKIDPVTGFVDLLKPKYTNLHNAKEFFGKFKSIRYNQKADYFEFEFDYSDFTEKANGSRTDWTVCTYGDLRYAYNKNLNNGKGGWEKRNVTESLKTLFTENGIDYLSGDLVDKITAQNKSGFFISLIKNLQVTLAMRYSCSDDEKDFILSPIADKNGVFYCSEGRNDWLPQDADANGAYNIARKGLCMLRDIDVAKRYDDWTTKISNVRWLKFVQDLDAGQTK